MGSARGHRVWGRRPRQACFVDGLTDNEVGTVAPARSREYREISRKAERLRTSGAKKSKASGKNTKPLRSRIGEAAQTRRRDYGHRFFGCARPRKKKT